MTPDEEYDADMLAVKIARAISPCCVWGDGILSTQLVTKEGDEYRHVEYQSPPSSSWSRRKKEGARGGQGSGGGFGEDLAMNDNDDCPPRYRLLVPLVDAKTLADAEREAWQMFDIHRTDRAVFM